MTTTVQDIIALMERAAPPRLADSWDNPGLQIGKRDWPVSRVMTALDPSAQVIDDAVSRDMDLLVTHHPLFFSPLKSIDLDTPMGTLVARAMTHRLAVYAAHTNLDRASGGLNDVLAALLALKEVSVLAPDAPDEGQGAWDTTGSGLTGIQGMGRVGALSHPQPLKQLALWVKEQVGSGIIRMVGDPEMIVHRVALCTGSGASLLDAVYASGAQAYISGDLRYHDARNAEAAGVGLLDIGHFASERLAVSSVAIMLERGCLDRGFPVSIYPCRVETDPFVTL